MAVKRIAVPGAVVQIGVATLLGYALAQAWLVSGRRLRLGWRCRLPSTVVLLRALEARSQLGHAQWIHRRRLAGGGGPGHGAGAGAACWPICWRPQAKASRLARRAT